MRRLLAAVTVSTLAVVACSVDTAEPTSTTANAVDTTESAAGSKPTTSAGAVTTTTTTAAPQTTMPAIGGYTFAARYAGPEADEFAWEWIGSFSIVAGNLEGSGTIIGTSDGECGIEGGTMYPVAYTAAGEFDITGTADDSVIAVVLRPRNGDVDLTVGDPSQLCVELSTEAAQGMVDFPLGDTEVAVLPIEVPLSGGATMLDFGDGFLFEVEITAL